MSEKKSHPVSFKLMSAEEVMAMADERNDEAEYRRGYHDGYVQALNQFYELAVEHGFSRDAAYQRLFDFWQEELMLWTNNHVRMPNGDVHEYDKWTFDMPPSPSMRRK